MNSIPLEFCIPVQYSLGNSERGYTIYTIIYSIQVSSIYLANYISAVSTPPVINMFCKLNILIAVTNACTVEAIYNMNRHQKAIFLLQVLNKLVFCVCCMPDHYTFAFVH